MVDTQKTGSGFMVVQNANTSKYFQNATYYQKNETEFIKHNTLHTIIS